MILKIFILLSQWGSKPIIIYRLLWPISLPPSLSTVTAFALLPFSLYFPLTTSLPYFFLSPFLSLLPSFPPNSFKFETEKNLILDIECGVKMGSYAFCTSIKILLFFFHILWLYPYDIHNKDFDSYCNYCLLQCH